MCLDFTITYGRKIGDTRYHIHPHSSSLQIFKRNLARSWRGVLDNITWIFIKELWCPPFLYYYMQLCSCTTAAKFTRQKLLMFSHELWPWNCSWKPRCSLTKGCRASLVITLILFFPKLLFSSIVTCLLEPEQYTWF